MRAGAGVLLVMVGLFILWLAITGRLDNVTRAWAQLKAPTTAGMVTTLGTMGPANSAPQISGVSLGSVFGVPPSLGLPQPLGPLSA